MQIRDFAQALVLSYLRRLWHLYIQPFDATAVC